MGKILLLAIAIWLVVSVLKRYSRNLETPSTPQPEAESMVQCAKCGIHLPRSEGFLIKGQYYCSEAHSKQGNEHTS
ncbi:MAG TPA: PP0621 family protein [Methylophilaceae bacterium]|jgi:uncharacterized protein